MKQIYILCIITLSLIASALGLGSCSPKREQKQQSNDTIAQKETSDSTKDAQLPQSEKQPDVVSRQTFTPKTAQNQSINIVLKPTSRDIPIGKAIHPDSADMKTEYDYYPLSTQKVKVVITNHSHHLFDFGWDYSLAYFDNNRQVWEPLPVDPIIEDIACLCSPHDSVSQTIKLYTSEVPNRPGKYRIYKILKGEVIFAEFEMVDRKGVERLRKRINNYFKANSISAKNMYSTYIGANEDTIVVQLINNSPRFQELFKREILSYSAVSHGKIYHPAEFSHIAYIDTLGISMKTEKAVYPLHTEKVQVTLTNRDTRPIYFDDLCITTRQEGTRWEMLHDNPLINAVGYSLAPNQSKSFSVPLYPLFNDNKPGKYRIYKEIGHSLTDKGKKWYMATEFNIE